jgi:hypothetical protein
VSSFREAITSMFAWYQNAAKCYVYLSDVSTTKRKVSDQSSECIWEPAFRVCRWFTRGWTLQELLALTPNARVFCWGYDANAHGERVSCQYLYDHARQLVSDLCLERRLTNVTWSTGSSWMGSDVHASSRRQRSAAGEAAGQCGISIRGGG